MPYDTTSLQWWLDALERARKGSDKSWRRECEKIVSIIRHDIARKAAQQSVQPTGGSLYPDEVLSPSDEFPAIDDNTIPPTSG